MSGLIDIGDKIKLEAWANQLPDSPNLNDPSALEKFFSQVFTPSNSVLTAQEDSQRNSAMTKLVKLGECATVAGILDSTITSRTIVTLTVPSDPDTPINIPFAGTTSDRRQQIICDFFKKAETPVIRRALALAPSAASSSWKPVQSLVRLPVAADTDPFQHLIINSSNEAALGDGTTISTLLCAVRATAGNIGTFYNLCATSGLPIIAAHASELPAGLGTGDELFQTAAGNLGTSGTVKILDVLAVDPDTVVLKFP